MSARRAALLSLAAIAVVLGLGLAAQGATAPAQAPLVAQGRQLFRDSCSSCHGLDARGVAGRGPNLRGVGAAAADFYLRTGRMPLANPHDEPKRGDPAFDKDQIRALVAYVGSYGGPPVPTVDPDRGDLSQGFTLFSDKCMGCHQVMAQGGIVTKGIAPELQPANSVDVAEAMTVGPYVMPKFKGQLTPRQVDSVVRYVRSTRHPDDRGGWGIGHVGPIPEGMVTWLLALFALVIVTRLIGERLRQ